jgi:LysR family transcriptional regulator, nitrogen assimilation regulatory protein
MILVAGGRLDGLARAAADIRKALIGLAGCPRILLWSGCRTATVPDRIAVGDIQMMQYRQLRYFVAVVEAGSISRAAATVHVAQPALSQQIADLEERVGISLLLRNPRGVKPTPAGEAFFREASLILQRMSQLPSLLRETAGQVQGTVRLGLVASLAPALVGLVVEHFRSELPGVNLVCSDGNSETLSACVQAHAIDLALAFEDELVTAHIRKPIFMQRLFLIGNDVAKISTPSVSLEELAKLPLVLPGKHSNRRQIIDRAFSEHKLVPNIVTEADNLTSELSAVRAGVGNTILNIGELPDGGFEGFARPLPLEPAVAMTCSIISCSDSSLTTASEAVHSALVEVVREFVKRTKRRGARLMEA